MKRALLYIILGFGTAALTLLALGQTKPPAPALPPPPIPDADRADFFQRQVELLQAQQTLQSADAAFQAAIQKLNGDCGEKFVPQLIQDGTGKKLICAVKQVVPPPPTSTPAPAPTTPAPTPSAPTVPPPADKKGK